MQGGQWPGGWTANTAPKHQAAVSAYLWVFSPIVWLLSLALFVAGSHGNPLKDVLTFLCKELLSSVSLLCIGLPLLPWLEIKELFCPGQSTVLKEGCYSRHVDTSVLIDFCQMEVLRTGRMGCSLWMHCLMNSRNYKWQWSVLGFIMVCFGYLEQVCV